MREIGYFAPANRRQESVTYHSSSKLKTVLCDFNPSHAARELWVKPLSIVLNRPPLDFEFSVYGDILVSEAVRNEFINHSISGVEWREVTVFNTSDIERSDCSVWEMVIVGWGGVASPESGIVEIERCEACGRSVFSGYKLPRRILNLVDWDGTDVFAIWPLPRYVLCVGSVACFLEERSFSGIQVRSLDHLPEVVAGTLSPGNPVDWAFATEHQEEIQARAGPIP
jgi:hypothetical protein